MGYYDTLSDFTSNLSQAKDLIDKAVDDFEDCSIKLARQFNDERQEIKKNKDKQLIGAEELWYKLNDDQKLKIVKKGLPWFIRLFYKINVFSSGVRKSGEIFFGFNFGNKQTYFERVCTTYEIKRILKL